MYGRADGMPSFQLTVAVCACFTVHDQYNDKFSSIAYLATDKLPCPLPAFLEIDLSFEKAVKSHGPCAPCSLDH